jgi:hypothetical protein
MGAADGRQPHVWSKKKPDWSKPTVPHFLMNMNRCTFTVSKENNPDPTPLNDPFKTP